MSNTDRILVKAWAIASNANKIVSWVYEGSTTASYAITSLGVTAVVGPQGLSGATGPTGPAGNSPAYFLWDIL